MHHSCKVTPIGCLTSTRASSVSECKRSSVSVINHKLPAELQRGVCGCVRACVWVCGFNLATLPFYNKSRELHVRMPGSWCPLHKEPIYSNLQPVAGLWAIICKNSGNLSKVCDWLIFGHIVVTVSKYLGNQYVESISVLSKMVDQPANISIVLSLIFAACHGESRLHHYNNTIKCSI